MIRMANKEELDQIDKTLAQSDCWVYEDSSTHEILGILSITGDYINILSVKKSEQLFEISRKLLEFAKNQNYGQLTLLLEDENDQRIKLLEEIGFQSHCQELIQSTGECKIFYSWRNPNWKASEDLLSELYKTAKQAKNEEEDYLHPYGGWGRMESEFRYGDFLTDFEEQMYNIFGKDTKAWPDWCNAYTQVLSWQFMNSHEGLSTYYENLYGEQTHENIQRAVSWLQRHNYQEIAEKLSCLDYEEEEPVSGDYGKEIKEVSDWIDDHGRQLFEFYLDVLISHESQLNWEGRIS